jgi:DNA-directed RNA polymerase subunit RPC12/RpoP
MCRYATSLYKPHYACFNCRKTFKRRLMSDINRGEDTKLAAKCPECSELMANMGKDFESPKKSDFKKWAHLKNLYTVGITFHSCGCTGPGFIPNSKEQLISYFENLQRDYFKEIEFWRNRIEPESKREIESDRSKNWTSINKVEPHFRSKDEVVKNQEAINYWLEKVKEAEAKLRIIKKDNKL